MTKKVQVAAIAAAILVVAGAIAVSAQFDGNDGAAPGPAPTPSPTRPSLPDGAAQGVIDVAIVSADRWYRLTTNVGYVTCSTVWQNDQSTEGGWERLHDFGREAYTRKVDARFGPVTDLVMAVNARDGWAWGQRLYSTHDGGHTWVAVTSGPGRLNDEFGHAVSVTDQDAWSVLSTENGTELWRTSLGSDSWVRADAPDMGGVTGIVTLSDTVLLETSDEGLSDPRLQYLEPGRGFSWGEVRNPCPGDNRVYAATSVAYMLCRSGGGATVYRLLGTEHTNEFRWQEFGRTTGAVRNVVPIWDSSVLVVGRRGRATLVTERETTGQFTRGTSTSVDLGTTAETFESSSDGKHVLLTSYRHAPLESLDGGRTWHALE